MDKFEFALDDCLRQLASGKSSLGQCLARYPDQAAQLRPLLETALRLQRGKEARPSSAARERARAKLAQHMEAHPRRPRNVSLVPRLAFVMVAVALAVLFTSTAFAQAALPGQPLYGLKLSSERVWRAASPDPVQVDITLANRRASELLAIADKKHVAAEAETVAAYSDVLDRLSQEAKGPDSTVILTVLEVHQQQLTHAGLRIPKLDQLVEQHGHGQRQGQGQGPSQP